VGDQRNIKEKNENENKNFKTPILSRPSRSNASTIL